LKLGKKSILEEYLGVTDLIPVFGEKFTIFYPTILIVLCLFNAFDIYGKFTNFLGFYSFGFKNNYNDEKIEEGEDALNKSNIHFILSEIELRTRKSGICQNG
jgi:hypothetical protein